MGSAAVGGAVGGAASGVQEVNRSAQWLRGHVGGGVALRGGLDSRGDVGGGIGSPFPSPISARRHPPPGTNGDASAGDRWVVNAGVGGPIKSSPSPRAAHEAGRGQSTGGLQAFGESRNGEGPQTVPEQV